MAQVATLPRRTTAVRGGPNNAVAPGGRSGDNNVVVMTETSVGEVCRLLDSQDLRYWVIGGWGVDALLGRCTREHKDLDVLLVLSQHERAWRVLHEKGYRFAYTWEENVDVPGTLMGSGVQPTAYVLEHPSGGQVDVHVIDDRSPEPRPLWSTNRRFSSGALDAQGTIDRLPVHCMSAHMQLVAHEGYELPETHQGDVAKLRELLGNGRPSD